MMDVNGMKGLVPSNFIEEVSISSSGKRKKTVRDVIRRRPDKRHDKKEKGKFPSKCCTDYRSGIGISKFTIYR
ncbi:hypothetical protein BSL78_09103 [Apostichopus japonicus]|uniref:Uncharacterized protein n=1 Tax=Stichopus japonicus TaxID=307972 RepID=A0A2G8L177_STIJA|nr:hypothetical protein BSL78_09103 [Apostichopus japonicus]